MGPGRHPADVGPGPVCRVNRGSAAAGICCWANLSCADGGITAPPSLPHSGHPRPGAAGQWEGALGTGGGAGMPALSLAHRACLCVYTCVNTRGRERVCTYG